MRPDLIATISTFLTASGRGAFVAPIANKLQWPTRTDAQGQAFYDNRDTLLPYVDSYGVGAESPFTERFLDLLGFLGTPYLHLATPDDHAVWLIRFNTRFGMRIVHPKLIDKGIPPQEVVRYFAEIEQTGVVGMPGFADFLVAHGADAFLRMYAIYAKWTAAGRPTGELYVFLNLLFVNNVDMALLTPATFLDTRRLMVLYPSNRRFSGFASWGTGDSDAGADDVVSYAANIENHFRKHVLNAGAKALDDVAECPRWWVTLGIALRVDQLAAVPASPEKTSALGLFNPDGTLPPANISPFLGFMHAELLNVHGTLLRWFESGFRVKYKDATLAYSVSMTDVAVFMERGRLFLSGRKNSGGIDFYIVGRLDNDVLTISSCYVATDIMAKINARDVLWRFPDP